VCKFPNNWLDIEGVSDGKAKCWRVVMFVMGVDGEAGEVDGGAVELMKALWRSRTCAPGTHELNSNVASTGYTRLSLFKRRRHRRMSGPQPTQYGIRYITRPRPQPGHSVTPQFSQLPIAPFSATVQFTAKSNTLAIARRVKTEDELQFVECSRRR
jgi:hypothetical protein